VKGIAVDMLGIMALAALTMVVGAGLIQSFSMDVSKTLPAQMSKGVADIVNAAFGRGAYSVCDGMNGTKIGYAEFKTLLSAMLGGVCNATQVQLDFSMTEKDLERVAGEVGASGALLINRTQPAGAGLLLVRGNAGLYPLKYDDTLNMTAEGKPKKDVMIEVAVQGCDPYDAVCQMSCSFKKGICDPYCYRAGQHEDVPCDIDCVDAGTGDGKITAGDRDGVCDLDCYNSVKDPDRAYDPDCVRPESDGICDPDSNGVSDGVCDGDCAGSNGICDPDCTGDQDCVCDGKCNGYCSVKCKDELTYPDNDPDCLTEEKGTECCGNAVCGFGEDCQKCGDDCPASGGCGGLGKVCCPQDASVDEYGCSSAVGMSEGKPCSCDSQCAEGMACSPGKAGGKYCCPRGRKWDGQTCKIEADVLIVALRSGMLDVYSASQLQTLESKVSEYQEALASDGLGSVFLYLDTKDTSDIIGSLVDDTTSVRKIEAVLQQLIVKVKARYLIIVGGYSRFLQKDIGCGSCSDPRFSSFKTDDFYADLDSDNLPDVPVGRIPDPNRGDLQVLIKAFDTYIGLHRSGGMDFSDYRTLAMLYDRDASGRRGPWASGVCAHKAIFSRECSADQRCSIEGDGQYDQPSEANGHELFMLLVHGDEKAPQSFWWDGSRRFMTSTDVASLDVQGSAWMVMACYAGMVDNKNRMSESMVMEFLAGGGAVYLGGTRTQMGRMLGSFPCDDGGDNYIGTLYASIGKKFSLGKRIGDAFLEGKKAYASSSQETCSYRTTHQTLLYGDPTLKIRKLWYGIA